MSESTVYHVTVPATGIATKANYFWASLKTIPDMAKYEKYKNRGLKYLGSKELIIYQMTS